MTILFNDTAKAKANQPSCWRLLLWAVLLSMLLAPVVQAQTVVSGTIASNTTWHAANSPYVVTADITIPANITLSIEAGTQIFMGAATSVTVNGGAIRASGSAQAPIRVRSDKLRIGQAAAPGDWKRWVLNASNIASSFDYVQFEHGQGIAVNSTSASFNYSQILNCQGAAITQNLAANLSGEGNSASGNGVNAVAVPAGDITSSVRWALKGIPYVVSGGVLSVGASPQIASLLPQAMQSGETISTVVSGTRLAGASTPVFSGGGGAGGVSGQILPGGSDTSLTLQVSAQAGVNGDFNLTLLTDAGEVTLPAALTVVRQQPKITTLAPAALYTNQGETTVSVNGSNLVADSVVQLDDIALPTLFQSATQLQATLPNQITAGNKIVTVKTPDLLHPGSFLISNSSTLQVSAPQATPDFARVSMVLGTAKTITLRLPFVAPNGGLAFALAAAAPLVAGVPDAVTVLAGQQSVSFTLQGVGVGSTEITISRSGWSNAVLPVTVIEAPRALSLTPITAPLVGVLVGAAQPGADPQNISPIFAARVGVLVGAGISAVAPKAAVVGTSGNLTVRGIGLNGVTGISLLPSDGTSFSAPVISEDGTQITTTLTVTAGAAKGGRRLTLRTASGTLIFMNPADAGFNIAAPVPEFDSIAPQVLLAGQAAVKITVRGRNFRDLVGVRFEPTQGMAPVGTLTANTDGTLLEFNAQANADAVSGQRVLIVQTAGGESSAVSVPGNTLQVARQLGINLNSITAPVVGLQVGPISTPTQTTLGPVVAPAVGVVVGAATPSPDQQTLGPLFAPSVGVVVGSIASSMTPKVGVVGSQFALTVNGIGLAGVTAADFFPNTGMSVSDLSINQAGTQISLNVSVADSAPKTQRRLVLTAGSTRLLFSNPNEPLLLVAAPAPTLMSIAPQVLLAGQSAVTLTVRGVNFRDVLGVRFEPAAGISALGSPTVNTDGNMLQVQAQAAADAVSGARTLIVVAAGGESSALPVAANTLQVARQLGNSLQAITAPPVGVLVGSASVPVQENRFAKTQVGVVVGSAATGLLPAGALKGSNGQFQIGGKGLAGMLTAPISLSPAGASSGVTLGAASVNGDGTLMTVPFSVAANAPSALYRLNVGSGSAALLFSPAINNQFVVLDEPQIASLSPTVMQRGRAFTLTVRGTQLRNVRAITLEDSIGPLAGVLLNNQLTFSTDGGGEKLSVQLVLDANTATGPVVVRLNHAAGATSAQPTAANTVNIVDP